MIANAMREITCPRRSEFCEGALIIQARKRESVHSAVTIVALCRSK